VIARRILVLDANILLRAVFGQRVIQLLEKYEGSTVFCVPDVCIEEARRYIADLAERRGIPEKEALAVLGRVGEIVQPVDRSLYEELRETAQERVGLRDPDDWPVAAVALLLDAPIWTEDQDFFGSGIATWTTDRIELYLRE
jgi:predicted nucleic acid-binding protein